jgi:hypothetical protein
VGALQPPWREQNATDPVPQGWVLLRPILEPGAVDEEDLRRSERLVDYFKGMLRGVVARLAHKPEDRRLEEFAVWVRDHCQGKVSAWGVYRHKRFHCRGKREVHRLFVDAVDRGWGRIDTATDQQHKGEVFVLENFPSAT